MIYILFFCILLLVWHDPKHLNIDTIRNLYEQQFFLNVRNNKNYLSYVPDGMSIYSFTYK